METYLERLSHARIEGPGITLAYMADDKTYVTILTPEVNSSNVLTIFRLCVTERDRGSTAPVCSVGFDG
jgi:hypothetical protein